MTEQLRGVLTTYGQRTAFIVLGGAILPALILGYILSIPLVGARAALIFLILVGPFAIIFFLFLGHHLKVQFATFRLRLVPGYAFAHLGVAVLLSIIAALLLAGSAVIYTRAAFKVSNSSPHISIAEILAIGWAIALLAFSAGYFFRPALIGLLVIVLQLSIFTDFAFQLIYRLDALTLIVILFLDSVWTWTLVKRMLNMREDMFEYRLRDDSRESQRYWWTKLSDETWFKRICWSRDTGLDRIRPALPNDFLSQVRHFEAGSVTAQQSLAGTTVLLVGTLWLINLLMNRTPNPSDTAAPLDFFTVIPAFIVFFNFNLERTPKKNLQSLFMLPLRREQIVSRYGSALFIVLLKNWVCYAAAGAIVAWMPIPGVIREIPSSGPLLTSLAVQLPLFGIFSLTVGRTRGFLMTIGVTAAGILGFASSIVPQFVPIVAVIGGAVLIWLSYRHWCQTELL